MGGGVSHGPRRKRPRTYNQHPVAPRSQERALRLPSRRTSSQSSQRSWRRRRDPGCDPSWLCTANRILSAVLDLTRRSTHRPRPKVRRLVNTAQRVENTHLEPFCGLLLLGGGSVRKAIRMCPDPLQGLDISKGRGVVTVPQRLPLVGRPDFLGRGGPINTKDGVIVGKLGHVSCKRRGETEGGGRRRVARRWYRRNVLDDVFARPPALSLPFREKYPRCGKLAAAAHERQNLDFCRTRENRVVQIRRTYNREKRMDRRLGGQEKLGSQSP